MSNTLTNVGTFSSGAGDLLSGGLTKWLNKKWGNDVFINYNSGMYTGGKVTGYGIVAVGALTGAAYAEGISEVRSMRAAEAAGQNVGRYPGGALFGRGGAAGGGLLNRWGLIRFGWYWEGRAATGRLAIGIRIGEDPTLFHIPSMYP